MILGVARAVGETAPVLFTAFGSNLTNYDPLHHPQADLPLTVFSLIETANQNFIDEAHGGALVLVVLVLTLFTLARLLSRGGTGRTSFFARLRPARRQSTTEV
jgi:phosphate transport system permease protein